MGRSLFFSSLQNKELFRGAGPGLQETGCLSCASFASPGMGESEEEMLVNALLAFEATPLILPSILFPLFSSHTLSLAKEGPVLTPT